MKTIYVKQDMMKRFIGIPEEEAKQKIEKGELGGIQMCMDRGPGAESVTITLLTDIFFGYLSDSQVEKLQKDYFDYVESITGMISSKKE